MKNWFPKFAFKWVNLCRYFGVNSIVLNHELQMDYLFVQDRGKLVVGLYHKLNSLNPKPYTLYPKP